MFVESAADLASFFNTDEFAEWATYTPPGGSSGDPIGVVIDRGQARQRFDAHDAGAVTTQRMVQAQIGDLPTAVRDGVFEVVDEEGTPLGESFKIATKPKQDETGRWWMCEVVSVD